MQMPDADPSWKDRFNKDFDLKIWQNMEPPPHMTQSDWRFAVMELHTMLTGTDEGAKRPKELFIGWKSKYGLL